MFATNILVTLGYASDMENIISLHRCSSRLDPRQLQFTAESVPSYSQVTLFMTQRT